MHSDWQATLERIDPTRTYTKDNIALECLEFNHARTWTIAKMNTIPQLVSSVIDIEALMRECNNAKQKKISKPRPRASLKKRINQFGTADFWCARCEAFKNESIFSTNHVYCAECALEYQQERGNTLRGFVQKCIGRAQSNQKQRQKLIDNSFTIDFDFMIDQILKQKGRGFYSGIPMNYKQNSDWQCSLERIDNNIGYTHDNVVLEAYEFNTPDFSPSAVSKVHGSGQWSRRKIETFYCTAFGKYILADMDGYDHWKSLE